MNEQSRFKQAKRTKRTEAAKIRKTQSYGSQCLSLFL